MSSTRQKHSVFEKVGISRLPRHAVRTSFFRQDTTAGLGHLHRMTGTQTTLPTPRPPKINRVYNPELLLLSKTSDQTIE